MTLKLFIGNIFFGACALLLAFLTSHIIDALYRSRPDLIEFPLPSRSAVRVRVFLLWIGFLVSIKGIWHTDYISSNPPLFIFLLIAAILLLAMTATDIEQHLLFDALTAPLAIAGLLCAACLALTTADVASLLLSRALASLGGGILFLIIAILTKGGIGGGDIKLIAALGLWLGAERLTTVIVIGLILGGMAAFVLLITGKKKRNDTFAYGPYFTIVALLSLIIYGL